MVTRQEAKLKQAHKIITDFLETNDFTGRDLIIEGKRRKDIRKRIISLATEIRHNGFAHKSQSQYCDDLLNIANEIK